jgi:hypothetical protein
MMVNKSIAKKPLKLSVTAASGKYVKPSQMYTRF